LLGLLSEARDLGLLGPGPVEAHVHHSQAFAAAVTPPSLAVDLGSGAGIPGLVLALQWSESRWVLLDASYRRTAFLEEAVGRLQLDDRVEVRCQRSEEAGRDPLLRGCADLVTARGFASPAVTAESAAPFLVVGGHLVVSEPPGGQPDRWPEESLRALGLVPDGRWTDPVAVQRLCQIALCPDRFPRRPGIPPKRPLF
jgi:16S rRNA (guanine527-N7)-methyltransferase